MDTLRLLYGVARCPDRRCEVEVEGVSFMVDPMPSYGLVGVEGNPIGGGLWAPDELLQVGAQVRDLVAGTFGAADDRGVSRLDVTTSRPQEPARGRALLTGLAALTLPRMETTRRGQPVHSVWWTGERSATIKCRAYDEAFKVETREAFERVRLEDQRRYPSGARPPLDVAADAGFQRQEFVRRFEPMRRAVEGMTAASFPVIAQALADEFRYGVRDLREFERLAGTAIALSGGADDAYRRSTYYKRRAEMRAAGFVVVDDLGEAVQVNLADELDAALEEFGS